MRDLPWGARRYKRDWLRGRAVPGRASPPHPERILLSHGALILAALLAGVAIDLLARAFGP